MGANVDLPVVDMLMFRSAKLVKKKKKKENPIYISSPFNSTERDLCICLAVHSLVLFLLPAGI